MRAGLKAALVLVFVAAAGAGLYVAADPERRDIDQSVRAAAPGRFVRLSEGFTHYELAGPPDGRVVVLAAGISVPYYIWDPTFEALVGAGFRVLRYDYFGRGYSDRPRVTYAQALYVRQLAELLDALEVRTPVDLVGLSYGGSVVTSFADAHPERVRSLVYIDPSFWSPTSLSFIDDLPAVWSYLTAIFDERWWPDAQLDDFRHPERFPDWAERYKVQLQFRGFRHAVHSTSVANAGVDQGPELMRVGQHPRPVLVFWGRDDRTVPFELSAALLQAMPRARLVPVEDAGHLPHLERPDVVNPALVAFLRS